MRLLIVSLAALLTMQACVRAPSRDLAGGWRGSWTRDGDALPVDVTFAKSGGVYSGSFDSDLLQVAGIPLSDATIANGRVHFELKGDESTTVFDGTIAGDTMAGTLVAGKDNGRFELVRAVLPSAGVRTEDITFQDRDVTLAGTVVLPAKPGKHPAIVFLHGSGPEGRSANQYLAQKFAERGVVALIYDKRGVGRSTGDWRKVGFEELADDAVAGIRWLRSRPDIDSARVGIYGHSQGGTIAPLVAARDAELAFIIASAAGGIDPSNIEAYSVGNSIGIPKLPSAERADAQSFVNALVGVAYRGDDRAVLDALAARFKERAWYFDPPPPGHSYWVISKQIASFDPAEAWRKVKVPVLLVYGAHDERVPPVQSAEAIQAALASVSNRNVILKMFPNADHTFTIVDPSRKGGWPKHEPDYSNTLVTWVLAVKSPVSKPPLQ